jgi:hypothetical protein
MKWIYRRKEPIEEKFYAEGTKNLELLHNRKGCTHVKNFQNFFLEMVTLGVKTCGESEFDIFEAKKTLLWFRESVLCFEAKKRFLDSGKVYRVLKQKTLSWFREDVLCIEAKKRFPDSGKMYHVLKQKTLP